MSLILDALRKSEAERRRGETPSLYSGLPTPGTHRRPSALRYLPWVVAAVLVGVAVFALRKDDAPATKEELTQDAAPREDNDTIAPDTGFETAAVIAATPPKISTTAPPAPTPAPAAPTPTVDALVRPPPAPTASAAATLPPAPTIVAAAPTAAAPPPAPAADAGADEQLPPLAVLDTATRSALPALKLSMHFYSSDPERRFAIIDGQRVSEGTQLGAAVVTQIRRDGVVLDVNGRRVLLPRP